MNRLSCASEWQEHCELLNLALATGLYTCSNTYVGHVKEKHACGRIVEIVKLEGKNHLNHVRFLAWGIKPLPYAHSYDLA